MALIFVVERGMTRALLIFCSFATSFAAAPHPDFSGTWHLSPAASNFGPATPPRSLVSRIRHLEPALIVTSTTVDARGEQLSEYRWWTDGYPCANSVRGLDFSTKVVWEGSTLVSTSKANDQQGLIEMTDRWTLTGNGKTLRVSRNFKTGGKIVEQTYVYERK